MVRICFIFFLMITFMPLAAQEDDGVEAVMDSLYREDQIYIGVTYNLLSGSPDNIAGSRFSGGFHTGFVRDFPLNQRRNVAVGIGLGWSYNSYGQNLFIGEEAETEKTIFRILDEEELNFDTNRFSTQSIDIPLQFRWRTSTIESYKFWRVYAGFKPSYVYHFRSNFEQPGNIVRQTDVPEFNRFRLGATFTFGYNTFNFHFYYSLNSFFNDDALVDGNALDMKTVQIGLMFFLL